MLSARTRILDLFLKRIGSSIPFKKEFIRLKNIHGTTGPSAPSPYFLLIFFDVSSLLKGRITEIQCIHFNIINQLLNMEQ